jgi:hypothetical protein
VVERDHYGTEPRASEHEAFFVWPEVGACLVRNGSEIVIDPAGNQDTRITRLILLGPALALAFQQRGMIVLHGSTVDVHGAAVGILGNSGAGKSTLAAAFCALGHKMVTDDVTPVDVGQGELVVAPGFPQMKLWPDAAASLGHDPEALPRLHPSLEKRACRFEQVFLQTPAPLKRLYVLADGPAPAIVPLPAQDALIECVRYSYQPVGLRTMENPAYFLRCAGLVKHVQVARLERPRSFAELAAVVRLVEEDLDAAEAAPRPQVPAGGART